MDNWKAGLVQSGTYYEGYVEDVEQVVKAHQQDTVTCYGTRRSRKTESLQQDGQMNENSDPESGKKCKVTCPYNVHMTVKA